ncbi:MAG: helix-turn-helix domain-containing protein [Actinobacteria bacterium]|nr:helix-turn-helix domain-containing protein [Actinomycetota bacterium]MBU1942920.1 helix-turn-helix domain-containing protein [Actinomycetota bacterium]MBU2687651.1 helix-turn-helix domain-containing protein [Actinomycetota bacterium]
MKPLLTAVEVAEVLTCTTDRVWQLSRQGRIPAIRLGERQWRYRIEDVLQALDPVQQEHDEK